MKNQRPTTAKTRRGNRVYRNKSTHKGEEQFAEDYSFRIQKSGELHRLNLGSNLETAKRLADQVQAFMSVPSASFTDLFDHPDFESIPKPRLYQRRKQAAEKVSTLSSKGHVVPLISEIISIYEYNAVHLSPTTITNNVNALRHISAGILGLRLMKRSSKKTQRIAWRKKVGDVPLDELSQIALESYRTRIIRAVGDDGIERGRTATTLNTYFRCAKSIFAIRMLPFYQQFVIQDPLPLRQIRPIREPSRRYVSKVEVSDIIKQAHDKFWNTDSEKSALTARDKNQKDGRRRKSSEDLKRDEKAKFIILLLTISCGLRPKEVSRLTWDQVDFDRKQICVSVTSYDTPKARSSEAPVDASDDVLQFLFEYKTKHGIQPFVIPCGTSSGSKPVKRAQGLFRALNRWLRDEGIDSFTPLYVFRKEAGSIIFEQTESYDMAADFLRNDPRIAREHYIARKKRLQIDVPGLANLSQNFSSACQNTKSL